MAEISDNDVLTATNDLNDDAIDSLLEVYRLTYLKRRLTWRSQPSSPSQSLEQGKRTIFVPLQDPFDEVSNLAFLTPSEMLRGIACVIGPLDRVYVKQHPVDKSSRTTSLLAELASDPRFVVIDASIHDLFEIADLVVTVNSGVGFEALLGGLPVITCGGTDYHLATSVAKSVGELTDHIRQNRWPAQAWRSRFVYYYFAEYIFDPSDLVSFERKLVKRLGHILQEVPSDS